MSARSFSINRFRAVLVKEFIQMLRDRLTFAMMVAVPIMQLMLFGYAINSDPRELPTAVVLGDNGTLARSIVRALENTTYFRIVAWPDSPAQADEMIALGEVQFVVDIPTDFSHRLERGERPALLVEADATDPVATGNALAALGQLNQTALMHDLIGPLRSLQPGDPPFEVRVHRRYNPEGATEYNIVPGLMGTILTMTLAMMTAVAVTREFERGTMENLLATPVRPLEVMLGKIIPYVFVGFVQMSVILLTAVFLFGVPMLGSLTLLVLCVFVFIAANLAVGFTFSTLARSQMQAMQMSMFFFLPSMLLSGFMFPFRGMPQWAQVLGEALPLTHFLRIVRGILLKGNGWPEILPQLWPILLFLLVVAVVALRRYRQTLD
ncbi:MAG TPA: ABC transporter permease [Methylomirabilota bacterium]|nr:ABC transporter permease [Methylomirabilota bacterium]